MSEAPVADAAPVALSVEQGVAALRAQRTPAVEPEDAPEAPVEAAEEPEEIEAETSPAEEPEAEGEAPAEEVEAEAEAEPVVVAEPPKYWSKDAKAEFALLPPNLQAVVLAQEGPREEAAAKAKSEAAAQTQAAQAEIGKVQQLADHLAGFLPQAIEAFRNRWGDAPDWKTYAEEYGADAAFIAKAEHDQHLDLLQKTAQATEAAQAEARDATVKAEFVKLAEIAPDLADPVEGPKRRGEITNFLLAAGLDRDAIKDISAIEMALARDAKLWREAQAALRTPPKPKPAPVAPKAPVRPAAAAQVRTTQMRSLEQHQARLEKSGDVMDAVRLLQARRKSVP